MTCLVCHEQRETTGVACAECLEELAPTIAITPEQVTMRGGEPIAAALVDPWGRLHRLRKKTTIGRDLEEGLCIIDSTISRRHAALEQRGDTWTLRDLGSSNGTFVEDTSFATVMPIRDGERLRFGSVAFFFLEDVGSTPQIEPAALGDGYTVRGPVELKTKELPRIDVKEMTIELRQPTGGGAGIVIVDGKAVQLTLPQYELVSILYQRAKVGNEHESVRGFVHPSELIRLLSLESAVPSEDHVRQLVRRLRRVLFKVGITNLIESRYGAGYRLRLRTM